MSPTTPNRPSPPAGGPKKKPGRPRWTSEALFEGANIVVIEHLGQDYVLRITRNGRLLLNKREAL